MLPEMSDKNVNIEIVAEKAIKNGQLLSELLDGLKSKEETLRYNCFKVLMCIGKTRGDLLYPQWDYFVKFLDSDNSYHKMSGIHLIAKLTKVDTENKFAEILSKYYRLLDDKSMIVAIYVANCSGQIIRAKPELESEITNHLLNIDNTHHESGRKALIKAGAIEAFSEYFEESGNKDRIIRFVEQQLDSESPKTRKASREFLNKFGQNRT